jgi:hypothetical protein
MSNPMNNPNGQNVAELQFGRYSNAMNFSPITVCTTVTCVLSGGNRLLCAHFSMLENPLDYDAVLTGMRMLKGQDQVTEMYIVRVGGVWQQSTDPRFRPTEQYRTIPAALGYNGPISLYETEGLGDVVAAQYLAATNTTRLTVTTTGVANTLTATDFTLVNSVPPIAPPGPAVAQPQPQNSVGQKIKSVLKKAFPCFG